MSKEIKLDDIVQKYCDKCPVEICSHNPGCESKMRLIETLKDYTIIQKTNRESANEKYIEGGNFEKNGHSVSAMELYREAYELLEEEMEMMDHE